MGAVIIIILWSIERMRHINKDNLFWTTAARINRNNTLVANTLPRPYAAHDLIKSYTQILYKNEKAV